MHSLKSDNFLKNTKTINLSIFFLSLFIIFTFLPILYTYVPVFGAIRIVLLSGIALLLTFIFMDKTYNNKQAWKNLLFILLLLFIITIILSIIVSFDRGLTLEMTKLCLRYFIIISIMVMIVNNVKKLDYILGLFAFCGTCMAVHTIINYFITGSTYIGSIRGSAIESGIFADPNDLALFFNSVLPILFYFFVKSKRKIIILAAIFAVITSVVLTYSRGGLLGMLAVFFGLIIFRRQERKKIILFAIVCIFLIISIAPDAYIDRISSIQTEAMIDPETGRYPGRAQAWFELAPLVLSISPVLGVGAGSSSYFAGIHYGHWGLMHNSFLQALVELGLVGFTLFLMLFFLPLKQYIRIKNNRSDSIKKHVDRYQFLLISLMAFAVTSFFLPQAYSVILFFLIGILIVQNELVSTDLQLDQDEPEIYGSYG